VTGHNVDLNRNCLLSFNDKALWNNGYKKLRGILLPSGKCNIFSFRHIFFHLILICKILLKSKKVLRQAILAGQYSFPNGMCYGGFTLAESMNQIKALLSHILPQYQFTVNIDLHTGFGERGTTHLFLNSIQDPFIKRGIKYLFKNEKINWGNDREFYTITGSYLEWVKHLVKNNAYIPMLFEIGTLNSQTTLGSIKSLQIMVAENQGAQHGYLNSMSEQRVKKAFAEMYYPSSPHWRIKVIKDAYKKLSRMMKRLEYFNLSKSIISANDQVESILN
jgi:hypothetical protein